MEQLGVSSLASIPFLALNQHDSLFFVGYFLLAGSLLIYKERQYPLPTYALATQATILTLLALMQMMRYGLARRAVLEKQTPSLLAYLLASLFVLLLFIFAVALQTYVLLVEVATNSLAILITTLEMAFAAWLLHVHYQVKQ